MPRSEPLEPRRLLATLNDFPVGVTHKGAGLVVIGSSGNDVIDLTGDGEGHLVLTYNGKKTTYDAKKLKGVAVGGGKGNDRIIDHGGWSKIDTLDQFVISGQAGNDQIETASPVALVDGEAGRDTLTSTGSGRVILFGGKDDDRLVGGSGDDTLVGSGGADFIDGRGGRDLWTANLYKEGGDPPHEVDSKFYGRMFDSPIKLTLDRKANDGPTGEGDDVRSVEIVVGSTGADTLDFSDADAGVLVPENFNYGRDSIIGSRFNDDFYSAAVKGEDDERGATIHGGAGNDKIRTLQGRDSIYGDAGNDLIQCFGGANDRIEGGAGNDTIFDYGGKDVLFGDSGNDYIHNLDGSSNSANDDLRGGSGKDTLIDKDGGNDPRTGFEFR